MIHRILDLGLKLFMLFTHRLFVSTFRPWTGFVKTFARDNCVAFNFVNPRTFLLIRNMESFTKDGVVPDVIDAVPGKLVKITYGSLEIQTGMVVTPTQVKNPPVVEYENEDGAFYTLIMNDPDAPSRKNPIKGEWHHWLVTNIPGCDVSKGDVMSEYVGSGPPKDTGLHRYVFLVFKQPGGRMEFPGLTKLTNRSGEHRANWKVREFSEKYKLGQAVAGNFYQAEYDDYCPQLYKQLSGK